MLHSELTAIVDQWLSGARIESRYLPDCPSIQLYLLNADFPQHALSSDEFVRALNEPMYWVFCWASGQVLANHILNNPELVRGKRVLDFGCGSGVVAVACAMAGASEVVAADIDPLAQQATSANLQLNGVAATVTGDWNEVEGDFDCIVVADVLYDKSNLGLLPLFLQRAPEVLVADSRVKNFDCEPYKQIDCARSSTWPDLDEAEEFREVRLYYAAANSK